MGIAFQLRATGQRLAQLAIGDFCRGWRLEFAIHAGATVEYLAKAAVAKDDVRSLFEKPEELTEVELAVLQPSEARQTLPVTSQEDRKEARERIATRKTINAKSALKRATELLRRDGRDLNASNAGSVLDVRNRAIHLADLNPANDLQTARRALNAAESLWDGRPIDLWGYFADAADAIRQAEVDDLHWSTVRRVALAKERHSLQGIVSNHERAKLTGAEPSTVCPACRRAAHRGPRPGPGPTDTTPWANAPTIEALTCLSCGLELFGSIQIDHALSLTTL